MAISELNILIRRCLHRRINANEVERILAQYRTQTPFTNHEIIASILNASLNFCIEEDPIIPQYLQVLFINNYFTTVDLLAGLIRLWKAALKQQNILTKLIVVETNIISDLTFPIGTESSISLTSKWLNAMIKQDSSNSLTQAVGFLLTNLVNPVAMTSKKLYDEVQDIISRCMTAVPSVYMTLASKISSIPRPDHDQTSPNMMNIAAFEFESNIREGPIIPIRSTTTMYFNYLFRTAATIDDHVIVSFLNVRYQDQQVMFGELVFAAIDAMTKSVETTNDLYRYQCQLFFIEKLPSILALMASSVFGGISTDTLLLDAWNYLNTSSSTPEVIKSGKRFLQICSLLQLISNDILISILGEDQPIKGLYVKDDLVNQVIANHSRGPRLVDELLKNDGNTVTISQAIMEIMHGYCLSKDTQHLKDMANMIVRKPASINVICVSIRPSIFLSPICLLLDDWKWDEIQGESQPVYDEFGMIFLLVLAFKKRLNLDQSELGVQGIGFLTKYFATNNNEEDPTKLSDIISKRLGDWCQSLYIDDAISDDLTTNCSAQEYYLLIPTLMRQSVLARMKGKLSSDAFKAGLEYLLEPFLMPSLVSVFGWTEHAIDTDSRIGHLIPPILTKQPSSTESREIHQTILSMTINKNLATYCPNVKVEEFCFMNNISKSQPPTNLIRDIDHSIGQITLSADQSFDLQLIYDAIDHFGPLEMIRILTNILIRHSGTQQFHSVLDFIATLVSIFDQLKQSLQINHTMLAKYIKIGQTLFAEAIVHLHRRVELYNTAFITRNLGLDQTFVPITGMNVANINLDVGIGSTQFDSTTNQQSTDDIDQILGDTNMVDIDPQNSFADMYGFQAGDLEIENLDDLDIDFFD